MINDDKNRSPLEYLSQNNRSEELYLVDYPSGYSGSTTTYDNTQDNRNTSPTQTEIEDTSGYEELPDYIYIAEVYNKTPVYQNINENISWVPICDFVDLYKDSYFWDYDKVANMISESTKAEDVQQELEETDNTNRPESMYEYSTNPEINTYGMCYYTPDGTPKDVTFQQQYIYLTTKNFSEYIPTNDGLSDLEVEIDELLQNYTLEDGSLDYGKLQEEGLIYTQKVGSLLYGIEGDCFYDRWECLKTYATTDKDYNQIVDVVSVPIETYVNLNARIDRNRGTKHGTIISDKNFNLFNPVYNQRNNIFTYYSDTLKGGTYQQYVNYDNEVILSLTKNNTENIDNWTLITQSSVVDLDGVNGGLTKLELWNDKLLAFQEKAINYIPFNARVAIEATDGVPIEIANSGKVDTPMVMTNKIGCQNKWSVCGTNHYLYFIDNYNQGIYRLGGEGGFQSLSDIKGFHSWMNQNNIHGSWIPYPDNDVINNFKTSWDPINNEILFVNYNYCLAFNENIDEFTSFYSYENIPYFVKLQNSVYAIRQNSILNSDLYRLRNGSYNNFFGEQKNYYITIIANEQPMTTKIFNTLEYTADAFKFDKGVWKYDENNTFTTLDAVDEYQSGTTDIVSIGDKEKYPDFRKRFRIWRTDIPRDSLNESGRQDRMSNPWLKLTLTKNTDDSLEDKKDYDKLQLYNIIVSYTEQ